MFSKVHAERELIELLLTLSINFSHSTYLLLDIEYNSAFTVPVP